MKLEKYLPLAEHPQDNKLLWYHIYSDDVVFHRPETDEGDSAPTSMLYNDNKKSLRFSGGFLKR